MKVSKFSEQQIALILKQVDDGLGVDDVCRKAGVSQQTYYRWRKKYGGLMPSEVRRLKQLEEENRRLGASRAANASSGRPSDRPLREIHPDLSGESTNDRLA